MTFEEFFKKKRIDLAVLKKAEGTLFLEFEFEYAQMGEKSFDHTKKFWFNKLRRLFPLAPEIKTEKLVIENQLAEQTITESLIENTLPKAAPKTGFVPRFKAINLPKTVKKTEEIIEIPALPESAHEIAQVTEEKPAENIQPKPAYKPKFNMKNLPPKSES